MILLATCWLRKGAPTTSLEWIAKVLQMGKKLSMDEHAQRYVCMLHNRSFLILFSFAVIMCEPWLNDTFMKPKAISMI
jgi:hypothetical protein